MGRLAKMMLLLPTLAIIAVWAASWRLTGWVRRQAQAHLLLDVPNARSSHAIATPKGGGLAIVVSTVAALLLLGWAGWVNWSTVSGLCVGGLLVAVMGFVDDRGHVAPRWRLVGHFAVAVWALAQLGGAPAVPALGFVLDVGWLGFAVAALYIVWMLNLTNFMDGIDGIAGVEVVTVCVSAAFLSVFASPGHRLWVVPLVLASATLGFLAWNWPPAKIFLGDAGSGFLGFMLAVLSLQAAWVAGRLFWSWVILLGVFIVDATITLIRRIARGERFYEAHRDHAYQHAALRRGAHLPVVVVVAVINLCWLLPIATLVTLGRLDGALGVLISFAPLVTSAVRLNAGEANPS